MTGEKSTTERRRRRGVGALQLPYVLNRDPGGEIDEREGSSVRGQNGKV